MVSSSNVTNGSISGNGLPQSGERKLPVVLHDDFTHLIEPLFNLPTNLPEPSRGGYIPFLFVLIKLLAPRVYVDLGVCDGASLIAVSTATMTYDLNTIIYGVDERPGNDYANQYEELKVYLDSNFSNTKTMRCSSFDARESFSSGAIDLLHIDGLYPYKSVKENYNIWLDAMAPEGVILLHGINVAEDGENVQQLWSDLKEKYTTLEFNYDNGLGVVLLDSEDVRVEYLKMLAMDDAAMRVYGDFVSLMSGVLTERMGYFNAVEMHAWKDRLINALYQSVSWKVTAPLRALKRLWARNL